MEVHLESVLMGRYDDRLDLARYERDGPVGVGPGHEPESYEGWVWIPERLFARMCFIAAAYEFHVLPGLDGYDRNTLRPEQVETLLDEVEFIGNLVEDPALLEQLEKLRRVAQVVTRQHRPADLIIEGP